MEDTPTASSDKPPAEVRVFQKEAMDPGFQVTNSTHLSSTNGAPQIQTLAPTRGPNNVRKTRDMTFSPRPLEGDLVMVTPKHKPRTGLTIQDDDNSPTDDILTAIPSDDTVMMANTPPNPARHATTTHAGDNPSEGPPSLPSTRESQPTIDDILSLSSAWENEWPHGLLAPYEPTSPKEIAFSAHVAPNGGFFPQATIPLERALLGIGPTQ